MNSTILATGSYLPETVLSNADVIAQGIESSDEWIVSHTGIRSRRVVGDDQATSDLAFRAAQVALERANVAAEDLGFIVCATSSPDHLLPSTASLVQAKLGARCGAVDVNSGCSGFVYATSVGFAMHAQLGALEEQARPVLVIAADAYSRIMNWKDRTTAVFFGDGAGAMVIGAGQAGGGSSLLSFVAGSDGSRGDCIIVPTGGSRERTTPESLLDGRANLHMAGRDVWNFAVSTVPNLVREAARRANLEVSDLDLIIPHQANAKMLGVIARELDAPEELFFSNVEKYGNTASASIGIALDEAIAEGRLTRGKHVVLVGFGAGLAWSAACIRW